MGASDYDQQSPTVVALRDVVTALQGLAANAQESMGAQRLPGSGTFAFRKTSDLILKVPVGIQPSRFVVPEGFFEEGGQGHLATSFYVKNDNTCAVRLRGSTNQFRPVDEDHGWPPFDPGFTAVFSTRYPVLMSAMAVATPRFPTIGEWLVPLEISYGGGV